MDLSDRVLNPKAKKKYVQKQKRNKQKKPNSLLPTLPNLFTSSNGPTFGEFNVSNSFVRHGVATPMSDISDLSYSAYSGTYGDFEDEVVNGGVDDDEYIL